MHLGYLIKKLDCQSKNIVFPLVNVDVNEYQANLKRVLKENFGSHIANSLVYCEYSQTFMIQVRVTHGLTLPVTVTGDVPRTCNLIFESVQTLYTDRPVSIQLNTLVDFVAQIERRCTDFAKSFTKA